MAQNIIKCLRSRKGFTLVEVLVTLLIFSVLFGALNTVLLVGDSSWQTNFVRVELQQELRKAMDWMKDDLRQTGPSAISDVPADDVAYTTITFQKSVGVSGSAILWDTDTTQFLLGGAASNQLQKIEGGVTSVLAQNIQSLQFTRLAATSDVILVELQAQKNTVKGDAINVDLDFQVQIRN